MSAVSTTVPEELRPSEIVPHDVVERRFYPRVRPPVLTSMGVAGTAGKLLDVSENGLAISTENEVAPNTVSRISIPLNGLEKPIEVTARVVWATESENRVGIQLLNLSENDREQIRKWQARETSSSGNGVRSVAQNPTARWIEKNEFLASLAAKPTAMKFDDGNRAHEEVVADSKVFPTAPLDGANLDPMGTVPDETRQGSRLRTRETSSQLALVAVVALIVMLCFGIGALFSNAWLKSSIEVNKSRIKPNASMPVSKLSPSFARTGTNEKQASAIDPNTSSSREQESFAVPRLNQQNVSDFPVTSRSTRSDNSRTSGRNTPQFSGSSNNSPVASKNDETSKAPIAARDTVPAAEPSSANSTSQPASVTAGNAGTASSTAASNTDLSRSTGPTDLTRVQINSNPATVQQSLGASARPSAQAPNMVHTSETGPDPATKQSRQETRNSVSSADRSGAATISRSTEENIPAPIFPSASSSTSSSTYASTVPERRETRLTIPKNNSSPILHVGGERVVESPAARIHIQRAIFVPDEHKWWWPLGKKREKEVLLGELVSRVDPQTTRLPSRSGHTVRVRAIVDKNGSVADLKPVSGAVELMPAVMRAVRQWHYQPTYVDATRVETEAYISFEFRPVTHSASRNKN
jgi:hypothetical protein